MIGSVQTTSRSGRRAAVICIVLLIVFEVLTCAAVRTKSPTFDEPIHALAASVQMNSHDFRLDYDNPPLWKWWVALPSMKSPIKVDTNDPEWLRIPGRLIEEWIFAIRTLYDNGDASHDDTDRFIARGRWMMSFVAVGVGVLIAGWSWRLGGPVAAVIATYLFALDPNFIGHGALVKNDVTVAFVFLGLAYACHQLGRGLTISRVLAVGLICGVGCSVKFSGVVLPVVAGLLILLRMAMSPWPTRWGELKQASSRAGGVFCVLIAAGLLTGLVIWASYGFRFSVAPDPSITIGTGRILNGIKSFQVGPDVASGAWSPPVTVRLALWSLRHGLLPEPWLNGLLYIYANTQSRPSFLLGEPRQTSAWAFYALAMAVKTPVATLAAIGLAVVVAMRGYGQNVAKLADRWTVYCLCVPPLVYGLFVFTSPSAVGLRHVLVIYPFLFIGVGLVVSKLWGQIAWRWVIGVLGFGLAIETVLVFPNYISFFNVAAGGSRGGFWLLGDSNLDWGQDLPLLAQWQREHADRRLYLSYFGTVDPQHYGIRYINLPGGQLLGPTQLPDSAGVIAISATNLQGVFGDAKFDLRELYEPLRKSKPIEVLGGSIYLYEYPLSNGKGLR